MELSYKIISRGTLVVQYGDKSVNITGELTFSPSVFYADSSSISTWNKPNEDQVISIEDKKNILEFLLKLNDGTKIILE